MIQAAEWNGAKRASNTVRVKQYHSEGNRTAATDSHVIIRSGGTISVDQVAAVLVAVVTLAVVTALVRGSAVVESAGACCVLIT